jgi:diguanylate cyclase (GGDEF)-like protein
VSGKARKHSTAFITAPIALLAMAAFAVVIGSLIVGARETDRIALARQRATLVHVLDQHGISLARELKVQTVWTDAYNRARARDQAWMHALYGSYLSNLLGYDRIYVLTGDNEPIYAFANGADKSPAEFDRIEPGVRDLIALVRSSGAAPKNYDVMTTPIPVGNGQSVEHRCVADVRKIRNTPSTVVISSIVPDQPTVSHLDALPYLLVAIKDLDPAFVRQLGVNFEFDDLRWIAGDPPANTSTELIKADSGSPVGMLAWKADEPGWQFVRQVALGLALALLLLGALATLLMRWGRSQAEQLVEREEEARQAAQTDTLTGLPNRVALGDILSKSLNKAKSEASTLAVLSVDIEQLREINDDFGHAVGDAVLLCAAARLSAHLRPGASLVRPGDDDFVILIPDIGCNALAALAQKIVHALAEPIPVDDGTRVYITASVGYVLAPQDGECSDELVRRVGLALEKAKENGGGTAVAFTPQMDLELTHRRTLESALRVAVANGAIDVVYQPIMDPTGQHVVAAEALARWTDPTLGPISPEIFVPLAEETGLIPRIGELILRKAVSDGLAWSDIEVAVNVSGAQIHHGDVVGLVRDVLAASRFPPERLGIEITETVLLADEKRADGQIKGLQALGVGVALDDFGSGYSSLLYLRKFGFDKLKIDRSFIDEIGRSTDSMVILASIIRLGLDLRMTITAEGVETKEQLAWLNASGCHQLQGYLFSPPLTAERMTQFIASHRPVGATG